MPSSRGASFRFVTQVAFDLATVTSLYTPLLAGGIVELLRSIGAQNLLAALLRSGGRSLVEVAAAHLELLNQQLSPEQAAGMSRAWVIGGENLLAESLRLWRGLTPPTRLINEYGPTETVVGCSGSEVQPGDAATGTVPIGRPIANTQLYVLDENMRLVSPGVTGELYIGGAGVARGYLNRPELTAERFVPDIFASVPGACLFRTGDLAQYQADGTLYCLAGPTIRSRSAATVSNSGRSKRLSRRIRRCGPASSWRVRTSPGTSSSWDIWPCVTGPCRVPLTCEGSCGKNSPTTWCPENSSTWIRYR